MVVLILRESFVVLMCMKLKMKPSLCIRGKFVAQGCFS